uniref:Uncharacterized protein n=1 Tax=Kwoniella bestiolae CBS 10118 TaxID=1296100 RepID=A0A1B9G949_9TREE|nr:hypothetical protein I302_02352 [Kwoniella bestiolae CBS 10118]OCF27510.1 hypothetical protein I302_02352 [Kwoniella bestiolae CBS 10118]
MAYPNNPSSPTDVLSALPAKFEEAKKSGQLYFFPSEARDVYSQGRRFNLRLCPALQDKQKAKSDALEAVKAENGGSSSGSPDRKRARTESTAAGDKQNTEEPFKPPYVEELYVGCLEGLEGEEGMSVLLNKYSLLPEHILLCPPSYQPQSLPPTPPQMALAYNILLTALRHPTRSRKLLGFYNGGEGAGASQKWRHLQFVEVPGGRAPVEEWCQSVQFSRPDQAIILPNVPYLHIIHPLPPHASVPYPPTAESNEQLVDILAPAMMKMFDLAFDALRNGGADRDGGWNLLITLDHLHLISRSLPSFPLPSPHQPLELNSLGYAGMMLVKSQEEQDTLIKATEEHGGLMNVLQKCGVPREWGEKAKEVEGIQLGSHEMDLGTLS